MGYYLVMGGEELVDLASTTGWAEFKSWVADELPEDDFPEFHGIAEDGLSQDLKSLVDEIDRAEKVDGPDDVKKTLSLFRKHLKSRPDNAESVFVTDGMGDEIDSEDDEWIVPEEDENETPQGDGP